MRRTFLFVLILAAAVMGSLAMPQGLAQTVTPAETRKIESARAAVEKIEAQQKAQAASFNGLFALREQLEPISDDLEDLVETLQQRLKSAQARLSEFGAAPAAGAPPEPAQQTAGRLEAQKRASEIEGHLRTARALYVRTNQLRDELSDSRRELFNARLFQHGDSFVNPAFWQRLSSDALPEFGDKLETLWGDFSATLEATDGWLGFAAFAALALAVAMLLIWLHRWLARRRWSRAPEDGAPASAGAIAVHSYSVFAMHALPLVATGLVLGLAANRLVNLADTIQYFLIGMAGALAAFGIGNGAVRAVFSPQDPAFRIIRCSDRTARRAVRVMQAVLALYLAGMIVLGLADSLSADISLTIAATGLLSIAVIATVAAMLWRPVDSQSESVSGWMQAPLNLLRPLLWLLAISIAVSLLFGFTALAGFTTGRAIASAVIVCLAMLIYVGIEAIFHEQLSPDAAASTTISHTLGISPASVDLAGTVVAGVLRVVIIAFTFLTLLSPWGIEFSNLNPFQDVFFGVRFNDLRRWIGAAGIALILFTVGLAATRLFVAWLDNQLLPRTRLDTGVRHSVSTIAGYIGIVAAIAIALAQAGVQLQNVALVAGALSVGVGFGLQQVVSNFVAGLIVLAERPIRVGDVIVVKGEEGTVKRISVRATELQLSENSTIIVPNADIISSVV
ncbi:MAG: DUF3772 domain-containing protein, partial [Beijerinckiaceae bacterium]